MVELVLYRIPCDAAHPLERRLSMTYLKLDYSAASHIGGRRRNEDNYLIREGVAPVWAYEMCRNQGQWDTSQTRVAAVCDGIGGGAQGDTASLIALKTIEGMAQEYPDLAPEELIRMLAEAAQEEVCSHYRRLGRSGGCTLSLLVLREDRWAYLNIGDSPAFLWRQEDRELTELSERHNLKWEKLRRGIGPEQGDECRLLRYLGRQGHEAREMAHVVGGELKPGDGLLLCTDGITNAFSQENLSCWLEQKVSAADLASGAASDPGADNCTAVCLWAVEEQN